MKARSAEADLVEVGPLEEQVEIVLPGEADPAVDLKSGRYHTGTCSGAPGLGRRGSQRGIGWPASTHHAAQ